VGSSLATARRGSPSPTRQPVPHSRFWSSVLENDSQTTTPGPDNSSTTDPTEAGNPAAEAAAGAEAGSPTDPLRPRRRRQTPPVPPSGTIDFFTQPAAEGEPAPPTISSAELMALMRELRRFQSWTPDSPEIREAMRELVEAAFETALSGMQEKIDPLVKALEKAAAAQEAMIRDSAEEAARRTRATDATLKSVEQRSQGIAEATRSATTAVDEWLKRTNEQVAKMISEPWWKRFLPPLGAATAAGMIMILLLTALRPGWTLTTEQKEALRIGESVSGIYLAASPKDQAEMRRVNRWRSPEAADTTTAPPRNR
jgi:hypothetical protein